MVPRHPPGSRTGKCCHVSPGQRGSPPGPTLFSSPAPKETTARPSHTLWPPAPFPSPRGRPAPPGSRLAERIYLHISTFVPCWRPISARGEALVLGGARAPAAATAGSRASRSRSGRGAHSCPGSRPPAGVRATVSPRPGPEGKDKEGCLGGSVGATFTCSCRKLQAPRWFAGALRVPKTASARSTCSTP